MQQAGAKPITGGRGNMEQLTALFNSTLLWQALSAALAFILLANLLFFHKLRIQKWRKRRVEKAMHNSGIVNYQANIEAMAKQNFELIRAPHDVSGIDVEMGLHNGEREKTGHEKMLQDVQLGTIPDNVVSIESTKGYIANEHGVYELEEYLMGKPTQDELSKAVQTAVAMRESGADDKYIGKCLLSLNYRNKLLEKVLLHAELYVHGGSDPHEHTLLLKAIQDVQAAGQSAKHDTGGLDGTFMIS